MNQTLAEKLCDLVKNSGFPDWLLNCTFGVKQIPDQDRLEVRFEISGCAVAMAWAKYEAENKIKAMRTEYGPVTEDSRDEHGFVLRSPEDYRYLKECYELGKIMIGADNPYYPNPKPIPPDSPERKP